MPKNDINKNWRHLKKKLNLPFETFEEYKKFENNKEKKFYEDELSKMAGKIYKTKNNYCHHCLKSTYNKIIGKDYGYISDEELNDLYREIELKK